jgi:hypothetical protein
LNFSSRSRPEKRKLSLFYDIVSGQSPDYLQDLLPITVGQTNNDNFTIPQEGLVYIKVLFSQVPLDAGAICQHSKLA